MNVVLIFSLLLSLELGFTFLNLAPALGELMTLYGVSYSGMSVLLSAMSWSHAALQVPAGVITDRFGTKRTMTIGLICLTIGNLMPTVTPSFGLALTGRVIIGIGTGLSFIAALRLISIAAPAGRAGAFQSFFAGGCAIGNICAYLVIPYVVLLGWRWIYFVPGLAAPLLLIMLLRLTLPSAPVGAGVKVSLGPLLRLKVIWMLGLMHALCWGVVVSFGNWVPALLADAWGGSLVSGFAWAGALVMLLSGLGRFLGGFFLLRISATLLARGAVLVMAFVFAGLFLDPGPAIFFILFLLAVWLASVNFGAFLDLTGRASPADSVASAFGFVNFLGNLGVIFLTLLFGFLKDETGSFEWVFIVLAVWAVVAFWASRSLKRRDSANSAPA